MSEIIVTGAAFAAELRKLADAVEPLARINGSSYVKPWLYISYRYGGDLAKQTFLEVAQALPKPFKKEYTDSELKLTYTSAALEVNLAIERSSVCEIVEPAKPAVYRCEPLLSDDEDSEIVGNAPEDAAAVAVVTLADIGANFAEGELTADGEPAEEVSPEVAETETVADILQEMAAAENADWGTLEVVQPPADETTTLQEAAEAEDAIDLEKVG